ncbi:SDR family NAD(P)-dependent oxidoreductase [Nonomuraea pusilla]|uniref:NAD(P)-dependent dehydrogenase, short-chain alcohol dehydrogenase family n=1 Tax=Nonomuraea pusilla TaxID=46177 RepID=A0A1H7XUY8_9ACTN|nr:SDR family oxidoreductase [Nonomuraea pusilla]SEM37453.1 NAD(P)-dependent dehydrogenase, short-chain alcohol dehydrogenase family [Nonomuraea pusilla]
MSVLTTDSAPAPAPVPVRSPLPSGLAGSTAVVVGGTSGIGLAAGVLLREVGARVVLAGRDAARLEAAVARVRGDGPADAVLGAIADVTDEDALARALDLADTAHHVLVTAGGLTGAGLVTGLAAADVREAFDSRAWGALAVAKAAATRLPAGGSITFSSGVYVTRPIPGMAGALAAVGAVETVTKALAVELAPRRLRVNALRFGSFDTPLLRGAAGLGSDEAVAAAGASTPLGRYGTADEAAAAALFLMANTYVTGQVITVDGGQALA